MQFLTLSFLAASATAADWTCEKGQKQEACTPTAAATTPTGGNGTKTVPEKAAVKPETAVTGKDKEVVVPKKTEEVVSKDGVEPKKTEEVVSKDKKPNNPARVLAASPPATPVDDTCYKGTGPTKVECEAGEAGCKKCVNTAAYTGLFLALVALLI